MKPLQEDPQNYALQQNLNINAGFWLQTSLSSRRFKGEPVHRYCLGWNYSMNILWQTPMYLLEKFVGSSNSFGFL